MTTKMAKLEISTGKRVEIVNVTKQVTEVVGELGVSNGLLVVSVRHTTCGMCINEDESGLRRDCERLGASLLDPFRGDGYHHDQIDDNAHSHIKAALVGPSELLQIERGELVLGTWQASLGIVTKGLPNLLFQHQIRSDTLWTYQDF